MSQRSSDRQSFTDIQQLQAAELRSLIDAARKFLRPGSSVQYRNTLRGEAIVLAFAEPSTRTRFSFELAAKRLGADVVNFNPLHSSQKKGETLIDTFHTFAAMGSRLFVVRHAQEGIMAKLVNHLPDSCRLVSAGEGCRSHPTQGLLDILTILNHRNNLENLAVAIVGDIVHSRVARSTLNALHLLGVKDIRLVGPKCFLPIEDNDVPGIPTSDLRDGLSHADVVIALRIQRERIKGSEIPDMNDYRKRYGLNRQQLEKYTASGSLLLHPGPVNWGVELDPELINWDRSLIREQVRNGVAVRMAVLSWLMGAHDEVN